MKQRKRNAAIEALGVGRILDSMDIMLFDYLRPRTFFQRLGGLAQIFF
jgi:hypothetical protein